MDSRELTISDDDAPTVALYMSEIPSDHQFLIKSLVDAGGTLTNCSSLHLYAYLKKGNICMLR
jgi:hypothetical protein